MRQSTDRVLHVALGRYTWPLVFSAIAVVYPLLTIWYGDIIPVNGGVGYDGDRWGRYAQNLRHALSGNIDAYSFQKSLVWFILAGAYRLIRQLSPAFRQATLTFSVTVAIVSYWIVNALCLIGTAFLWRSILEQLKIRPPVALLSYFLLFINVCNLRMPAFYVTIGDVQMTFV